MRIGIFTDTFLPDINGVATSSSILRNELLKHGHEVFVVTTELPEGSDYPEDDTILRLPGIEFKRLYGYRISNIYSFKGMKEIKNANLDVIHIQTEFGIGIFGKIVGEILNIPVIYTYHTLYEDYTHYISSGVIIEPIMKKIVSTFSRIYGDNCTELIVPSDKTKDILVEYGIDKDIHVIPTGLELDKFNPQNKNKELIKSIIEEYSLKDEYKVLFLGRVAKEKSIDILIDAFKIVKDRKLNAKLIIVGGGPSLDDLKQQALHLGVEDYVVFTGPKPAEQVPSFYHVSDIFACASITETQGLTFIEAMASGIPVLARHDKNLEEIIIDERNGYYFNDANGLADLIEKTMNEDRNVIKENAIMDARKFGSEIFCEKVVEVYQSAIINKHYIYHISAIYPLSNNFYEVVFKSDVNEVTIELSEKVIMKYDLEKNKVVEREVLDDLKDHQMISQAYKKALRYLTIRDYTYKQMYDKLSKDDTFDEFHLDMTLEALMERNLINDQAYATDYFKRASKMGVGMNKAIRNLSEKGISQEIIDECLIDYSMENEKVNAKELVKKINMNNTNKSRIALINTIRDRLYRNGFTSETINEVLDETEFHVNEEFEKELLEKEFEKAFKKYSKKYTGTILSQKIFVYLNRKSFESEFIKECLNSHEGRFYD